MNTHIIDKAVQNHLTVLLFGYVCYKVEYGA